MRTKYVWLYFGLLLAACSEPESKKGNVREPFLTTAKDSSITSKGAVRVDVKPTKRLKMRRQAAVKPGAVSIEQYGAKANIKSFDNAPALIKALQENKEVLIPANKTFTIRSVISVSGLIGRTIIATGATIINRNYNARTMLFTNCKGIAVKGGLYTRDVLPTKQNGHDQSTIGFKNCTNVTVTGVHIKRSPEMGIDNNIVIGGNYSNNIIENCLRDGIYAHYSANLKYVGNTLNQIKDDALSIHDYGLANQKTMLYKAGYKQAGYSIITGNKITNCIQGVSSIGCKDVTINKNVIANTVHAGICVFNSEDLYPNSDARVTNVKILNNVISNSGIQVVINGNSINNLGQISSGRAAIFVACDKGGKAFTVSKMRSRMVVVSGNEVTKSAVNGATLYNIDGLTCHNNRFVNCHSETKNAPEYTGDIVEILNCADINVSNNQVIDNRSMVLHNSAYKIANSTGNFTKGVVKGVRSNEVIETKQSLSL